MNQNPAGTLSKFLGQGSAHEGAHHWRAQRLSALALMPLTIWFVAALLCLPDFRFETVHAWAAAPWRAFFISLLVCCIAWHSQLGVQVVVEDYVYGKFTKPLILVLNAFAHVLLGAAGVFAALRIAFKG